MISLAEFAGSPAEAWHGALRALWWARQGDWERAHEVAQGVDDVDGSWVHAMLHRQEGDLANARYWYRRAGRPVATGESQQEMDGILADLLGRTATGN